MDRTPNLRSMGRERMGRCFRRMMLRAGTIPDCPQKELVVAVLEQAGQDLMDPHEGGRARMFIGSREMDMYCDLIGLDPEYARDILKEFYTPKAA